jgi:hypothetical protein
MSYILVRNDGKYAAPPGRSSSYTAKLEEARQFPTAEAAERERCVENERVASVASLLGK